MDKADESRRIQQLGIGNLPTWEDTTYKSGSWVRRTADCHDGIIRGLLKLTGKASKKYVVGIMSRTETRGFKLFSREYMLIVCDEKSQTSLDGFPPWEEISIDDSRIARYTPTNEVPIDRMCLQFSNVYDAPAISA